MSYENPSCNKVADLLVMSSSLPLKSNTVVKIGMNSKQPENAVPKRSKKRRAFPVEVDKVSGDKNGRVRQKKKRVTAFSISGDGHVTEKPSSETFFSEANAEIEKLERTLLNDDFLEDDTEFIRPETIKEFSYIFENEAKVSLGSDETLEDSESSVHSKKEEEKSLQDGGELSSQPLPHETYLQAESSSLPTRSTTSTSSNNDDLMLCSQKYVIDL